MTLDEDVWRELRELEGDGCPGMLQLLAVTFVEDAADRLRAIADHVGAGNAAAIRAAAHSLKGMCGVIGACTMAALSAELERAADATASRRALIASLDAEFARVRSALDASIGRLPAREGQLSGGRDVRGTDKTVAEIRLPLRA